MRVLCSALVAGLLVISNQAYAQVKEGSQQVGMHLGFSSPLGKGEDTGFSEKIGKMGPAFGFNYLYQYHKNVGLGGEFAYKAWGTNTVTATGNSVDLKSSAYSFLALAKGQLMPDEKLRPYGLFGLGFGSLSHKASAAGWTGVSKSKTGVAFAIGGGADYDINDMWSAGAELRYSLLGTKITDDTYTVKNGNSFDFLFNLGYKFGA